MIAAHAYKTIIEPEKGDIVFYKDDDKYRRVKIVSGYYHDPEYGRLSNFWSWVDLDEHGHEAGEVQHGYGNFFILT